MRALLRAVAPATLKRSVCPTTPAAITTTMGRSFSANPTAPQLFSASGRTLEDSDPVIATIIRKEHERQSNSIVLIASENFTSKAVLDALGSVMQNKYSEGYPGARYYGGNEFIDMAETTCQQRALDLYSLKNEDWGVNVQALSGSPANFAVYTALLPAVSGRIMSLDLPHGGHLSHGYSIPGKNISAVSKYFTVLPYRLDETTGLIDMDTLEKNAKLFRPSLIVMGASAYSRHIDYARFRKIADSVGAILMMDMAHISGLIAGKVLPTPFDYADVVTTTTHKSLRGPRGAMIFFRKGVRSVNKDGTKNMWKLQEDINFAVFPGHQGGPHNHTITALAVALKQAQEPSFQVYAQQVVKNSTAMANRLMSRGYSLVSGGTDNHLMLVDLRPQKLNGAKMERVLELSNIAINKNTVPGDTSALNPSGIRVGTPAMTSRGFKEADFLEVAEFLHRGAEIASSISAASKDNTVKAFRDRLSENGIPPEMAQLKADVIGFVQKFDRIPM